MLEKLETRIREKISVTESGCWEWIAARDPHGYGRVRVGGRAPNGKTVFAHRHVYRMLVAEPDPLPLDHLCRNPPCCNPAHLEPVPGAENTRRGSAADALRTKWRNHRFCPQGHPLFGDNLYEHTTRKGYINKQCKACRSEYRRRSDKRRYDKLRKSS